MSLSLKDVLEVYTPEVTRFLFAATKPNTEFSISFDLDVIKIYEDYDKFERIYYGVEDVKEEKKEHLKEFTNYLNHTCQAKESLIRSDSDI